MPHLKEFAPLPPIEKEAEKMASKLLDSLTKPQGSLGALEATFIRLAGITGRVPRAIRRKLILVFAADHGVAKHRVSAYPQRVTSQMIRNFDCGGAAINVFSRLCGAELLVTDVGVVRPPGNTNNISSKRIRAGTSDFTVGPALKKSEVWKAILVGMKTLSERMSRDLDVVAVGEMGISNTTSAAALTSVFCQASPRDVTGPGTGLSPSGLRRKISVIEKAIEANGVNLTDPVSILAGIGGLEICALAGVMIQAAQHRIPILLDGFITGAAALAADALLPGTRNFMIAGHVSPEPGHSIQLEALGLVPLLRLGLRLGEGTGAALAIPLLEAICAAGSSMATFETARVAQKSCPPENGGLKILEARCNSKVAQFRPEDLDMRRA